MPVRYVHLSGVLLVLLLLLTSVYLQLFQGIMPCPLCTLQRFTFGILGLFFLIGLFVTKKFAGRIIVNTCITFFSLVGIALAGRQIWLQHYPTANNNECGVSLQYMLEVLPLNQAVQKIFAGSAECTQRGWELLHFNMAEWALIWFLLFLLASLFLFLKEFKWHN